MFNTVWTPCAFRALPIGAQVNFLGGHGYGVVVGYNTNSGFYTGRRYPYIVKFYDDGYTDVYCTGSIQPVPALPAPKWVACHNKVVEGNLMCFPWNEEECTNCPTYINMCSNFKESKEVI